MWPLKPFPKPIWKHLQRREMRDVDRAGAIQPSPATLKMIERRDKRAMGPERSCPPTVSSSTRYAWTGDDEVVSNSSNSCLLRGSSVSCLSSTTPFTTSR